MQETDTTHKRDQWARVPRKLRIAIAFTDIAGSTLLARSLGDRAWWELVSAHNRVIADVFVASSGRILKHLGDGCLAVFATPADGVEFLLKVVSVESARGVPVRAGLHYGSVYVTPTDVVGISVHLASRLAEAARPGTVLLSERASRQLPHPLCTDLPMKILRLRGFDESIRARAMNVDGASVSGDAHSDSAEVVDDEIALANSTFEPLAAAKQTASDLRRGVIESKRAKVNAASQGD